MTLGRQRADRRAIAARRDARFDVTEAVGIAIGYSGVIGADAPDHAARAKLSIGF